MAGNALLTLSAEEALTLCEKALAAAGAGPDQAAPTARALVAAERDGQKGHGLSRIPTYAEQLRTGKVDGGATPSVETPRPGVVVVDAAHGFAYPAIEKMIEVLPAIANAQGVALGAIRRSHHFGQAGAHVERLAEAGVMTLLLGNSPSAMAFWGGARPMLGTNPIAFAAPVPDGPPLVIDLALSVAARGKIVAANKNGEAIPEGWALDVAGQPTTDAAAALKGSMAPMGGAKGATLAMMVEIFAAALVGAHFGWEASSFLGGDGPPPNVGQVMIAISPTAANGDTYAERMATFLDAVHAEEGVRLPGTKRLKNRALVETDGLSVQKALLEEIKTLAGVV